MKVGKNSHLLLMVALLYIAHALPLYFFNVAVPAILREQGVDVRLIGMLSLLYLPWAFKFLWASVVDNHYLPKLGKRKSWLVLTQACVILLLLGLSAVPLTAFGVFVVIAFLVSLASATQDIAIDGYTVEQFDKERFGTASAMQSFGVAVGSMAGGAGTLWLYQAFGRQTAIVSLAVLIMGISVQLYFLKENTPTHQQTTPANTNPPTKASLLKLLKKPQTKWLLLLIVVFRFVEAPAMAMLNPMLVDFGFSLSEIGLLFSVFGAVVGIVFALLAGVLSKKIGTMRCLIWSGWLRTLAYGLLCLCLLTSVFAGKAVLSGLVLLILAIRYLTMTALYALFMECSDPTQAGTDFTLFVCLELLVYFVGGAMSGFLVHSLGYGKLFLWLGIFSCISMGCITPLIKKLSFQ